jgi:hypothetical protein
MFVYKTATTNAHKSINIKLEHMQSTLMPDTVFNAICEAFVEPPMQCVSING